MATMKMVFIQHDMDSFTGSTIPTSIDPNGPFYVYGEYAKKDKSVLCGFLGAGSANAFSAFPNKKVQSDVDSAKTSMGINYIDSFPEADSITWTLNGDKTELTMTAQFTHPTTAVDDCKSFNSKIQSKDPFSSKDVYVDFDKGVYTL